MAIPMGKTFYKQALLNKILHQHMARDENQFNRHDEVMISRVRIGHTRLTHSYLLNKDPAPSCDTCQCTLTINHIFLECPNFHSARSLSNIITTSPKEAFGHGQEANIIHFIQSAKLSSLI